MKILKSLFPLSLLTVALMACTDSSTQNQPQVESGTAQTSQLSQSESARLSTYFADMFEQDLKRSPLRQSYLGYKWDYDKWDQIDEAANDETLKISQQRLAELQGFDESRFTT